VVATVPWRRMRMDGNLMLGAATAVRVPSKFALVSESFVIVGNVCELGMKGSRRFSGFCCEIVLLIRRKGR
jgi:hypothetical protein